MMENEGKCTEYCMRQYENKYDIQQEKHRNTEDNLLQAYQKSVYRDGDMCYNSEGNKCI